MRRLVRTCAGVLAAAMVAGSPVTAASAQPITLGMAVATTGAFAGGEAPLVNGVKLAIEELNAEGGIAGQPVELILEDTGSEQTGAINAFNRIVARDPVAIINTTLSGFVLSQVDMIEDEGIPTFTGAAAAQLAPNARGTRSLFRVRTNDERVAAGATRFAIEELGARNVAVLRINNEYGNGWLRAIEATLGAAGMTPVTVESYEGADRDLTPQLLRIKSAGADVMIVAGDPANHVVAVQQIRRLGLDAKVILSNAGVLPTTLRLYDREASNGIYGTVDSLPTDLPANDDWSRRYRQAFDLEPDYSAAEYYDAVMMLAAAIEKVGTDKDALVDELRRIRDYEGVGNTYTFADNGDGGTSVAIVQIDNGALKLAATVD